MASESAAKRQKMDGPLIGTHNGHFHADEALAVYMLRLLPTYAHSPLVRTRDPDTLKECHTVVDVGGVHDDAVYRFDHHQREFNTTFPGFHTKLSSAGLVYNYFGKDIIAQVTGLDAKSPDVERVHTKIYRDFIEAFDANDNGVSAYDTAQLDNAGVKKRFNDRGFSIASVVNRYNYAPLPASEASTITTNGAAPTAPDGQAEEDARFLLASSFTGQQFVFELTDTVKSWLPAYNIVASCFASRHEYDSAGRIMVLPHRKEGLPYHDHLDALEADANVPGQVLYTLFPENGEKDGKWRIRAVAKSNEGFENRKPLPEKWRGVRDEQLSEVAGIPGCVFVHASGFIGGNKTFEGVLQMAKQACKIN